MTEREILHGVFDIETHKKVFVDYLEIIIRVDGVIEYAVPSHQEKLIKIATEKLGITKSQLFDMCPTEYLFDVCKWLCIITDCVSVWNDFYKGDLNEAQREALQNLKNHGLYRGKM